MRDAPSPLSSLIAQLNKRAITSLLGMVKTPNLLLKAMLGLANVVDHSSKIEEIKNASTDTKSESESGSSILGFFKSSTTRIKNLFTSPQKS